jgi:hypothetical protein
MEKPGWFVRALGLPLESTRCGAQDNKVLARARPAHGEEGWGRGAERVRAPIERPVLRGPYKRSSPPERETPKDNIILARARLAR